ncbi:MAG: HNH endonuclease [Anaerolineaceae bacterium]|nr:HNH endonuclease [Anaerolineaceae bacterium]
MTRISDTVRQQVRERAKGCCEYCGLPDKYATFSHQIDHIVPHRHGGTDQVDNLAWACFQCNNNKGTDIASFDFETDEFVFLFNPRKHLWNDHFVMIDGVINGITPSGRITIRLLNMNDPERSETRRNLAEAGLWK